jgi:hypothetical protein
MFKTKLKALVMAVASVAAIAAVAPASAAITTPSTGNGELFFSAWDTATQSSYTRDLGLNFTTFSVATATASGFNASFAVDSTFSTWLAGLTNPSLIKWNVVAADSVVNDRLMLTHDAANAVAANFATTNLNTAANNANTFVLATNLLGTHSSTANGSNTASVALNGNGSYAGGSAFGSNFGNVAGIADSHTGFGSTFFSLLTTTASGGVTPATETLFSNAAGNSTWTLANDGTLTYDAMTVAAVPEPSTWAMLMVGLLGMGAVARRRVS